MTCDAYFLTLECLKFCFECEGQISISFPNYYMSSTMPNAIQAIYSPLSISISSYWSSIKEYFGTILVFVKTLILIDSVILIQDYTL